MLAQQFLGCNLTSGRLKNQPFHAEVIWLSVRCNLLANGTNTGMIVPPDVVSMPHACCILKTMVHRNYAGYQKSSCSISCLDCKAAGSSVLFVPNMLQKVLLIIAQKFKGIQKKTKHAHAPLPHASCSKIRITNVRNDIGCIFRPPIKAYKVHTGGSAFLATYALRVKLLQYVLLAFCAGCKITNKVL